MKLNVINSILVLVLSIVACRASSSKTIPTSNSSKTIPTSSSTKIIPTSTKTITTTTIKSTTTSTTKVTYRPKVLDTFIQGTDGFFTTSLSVAHGSAYLVLPNSVADVKMTCYPPKGLAKRDVTVTKTIPKSSKVIPNTSTSSTSININSNTLPSKTTTTFPSKTTTTRSPYIWEIRASQIANEPLTQGQYTLYRSYGAMTVCKIYTRPYPEISTIYFSTPIKKFTALTASTRYPAIIDDFTTTSLYKTETTSIGYTTAYTSIGIPLTVTAKNQVFDNYEIHCSTTDIPNSSIPYIETVTYETPIDYVTSSKIFGNIETTTFLGIKTTYVTSYSSGIYTYSECEVQKLSSTKQPPVITTTTNEQSSVISTSTTSTKQPPVITTTTTTTTTATGPVKSTKCIPAVITVTEKEKVTVTEKETVTVTVTENDSIQTNDNVKCAKKWAQCGGVGFNGPTCCESGSTCKELNQYYSQCI